MEFKKPKEGAMGTVILISAFCGFILLFASTCTLVALNWSEKTLAPVLSILLVGTATTLAAVAVSLKKASIESAFTTSVVLDVVQGTPAFVMPEQKGAKISHLEELSMLGSPVANRDGKAVVTIQKPTNNDERFTFCGELLQYQTLRIIEKLQRGSSLVGQRLGTSIASVSRPMKLSSIQDYPGSIFLDAVAGNRFSDSDMERSRWRNGHMPLPNNTKVALIHQLPSPATGVEKFVVRIEKPLFFRIDFVIQPLGGTGLGMLPSGISLPTGLAANCQTYQYQVSMQATFEWITAGNSQTQEYKDWADWLFTGIRENLSD